MGVARSHDWTLEGVQVREMLPAEAALEEDEQYTLFHPSEIELGETTHKLLADVERVQPSRVVFDSLSELRLLAGSSLRYRRQILALKQYFTGRKCTVLLLDDLTASDQDLQVQSIAHAVIRLEQFNPDFGGSRRRLLVSKYRGMAFRGGYHDYKIVRGGLVVYPRLVASEHTPPLTQTRIPSGLDALDSLLGGGVEKGTSTLLVGAPGTGKSSLAVQFALAAARRGECAALFIFDESIATMRTRCEGLGMDLGPHIDAGDIHVRQVDPAELSPGELVHEIREAVTMRKATVVVIDSLNGYLNAMPNERFLIIQLHELLTFLGHWGCNHAGRRSRGVDRLADAVAGRCELPRGLRGAAAVLRVRGRGEAGDLGGQEAWRRARAHDSWLRHGRHRHSHRTAAAQLPRRADWRSRARSRALRSALAGAVLRRGAR